MRAEQTVDEMAEEGTLEAGEGRRHANRRTARGGACGRPRDPCRAQLEEFRCGPHRHEETRYWQANLLFERVSEQAGHPVHPPVHPA
jgi:hypothetical protein